MHPTRCRPSTDGTCRNLSEALQEVVTRYHAVIRTVVGTMWNERVAAHQTEQGGSQPATVVERRKPWTHATPRLSICIQALRAQQVEIDREWDAWRAESERFAGRRRQAS